jgi:hypothetical protein
MNTSPTKNMISTPMEPPTTNIDPMPMKMPTKNMISTPMEPPIMNIDKPLKSSDINKDRKSLDKNTDIEKYIENQIESKLNSLLKTLPDTLPKNLKIKPIYNLTIKELYKNTLQTLIDIINDIIDVYSKKDYINNNNFIFVLYNIFTKNNRKIYVGIMFVILSFIIYFIDGASI